jgi:hypothetical protein
MVSFGPPAPVKVTQGGGRGGGERKNYPGRAKGWQPVAAGGRKNADPAPLAHLAGGATVRTTAARAGVSERTAYPWLMGDEVMPLAERDWGQFRDRPLDSLDPRNPRNQYYLCPVPTDVPVKVARTGTGD